MLLCPSVMKFKNPLVIVLVAQFVVLFGAVGFLAGRALFAAPPPAAVKAEADADAEEEDLAEPPEPKKAKKHGKKAADAEEESPQARAKANKKAQAARAALAAAEEEEAPAEEEAAKAEEKKEEKKEEKGKGAGKKVAAKGEKAEKPEKAAKEEKPAKEAKAEPAEPEKHASKEAEPVTFESFLSSLVAGNGRAVEGVTRQRDALAVRANFGEGEKADAIIVTCTDSRVVPELAFDQPAGTFAVFRVPGAQLDDANTRALDEAIKRLSPRAVLVMGHLGCSHTDKALSKAGPKHVARPATLSAALSGLQSLEGEEREEAVAAASVSWSAWQLRRKSKLLGHGPDVPLLRVVYRPESGQVRWLDGEEEPAPAAAPRSGRQPH